MNVLKSYSWPGNVRELKNVLMKAVLESRGPVLLADAVEAALAGSSTSLPDLSELRTLEQVQREHILAPLPDAVEMSQPPQRPWEFETYSAKNA